MLSRNDRSSDSGDKMKVGVLFGGRSAEHEVSIMSARNVVGGADENKYDLTLIGLDRTGAWHYDLPREFLFRADRVESTGGHDIRKYRIGSEGSGSLMASIAAAFSALDIIFPVLHGPYGEDGKLQGMFEVLDIPYVGAGVLGSAIGMDKDVMKRLFRQAGIPTPKFLTIDRYSRREFDFDAVVKRLGVPIFIKPSNLGSSVGINMVQNAREYAAALDEAFRYGDKVVLEERIIGREIECSVIGNEAPRASLPGEILLSGNSYYSYGAKYDNDSAVKLGIPAVLPADVVERVQTYSVTVFKILCCEGMARVDFFIDEGGVILVNEINTIPGFTNISMFPKLWEASGLVLPDLIDELIRLAIERHKSAQVFIGALLLNFGIVDYVVGGCGTGIGFMNSIMQYPNVFCGYISSPLDAWLFTKINSGNAVSLRLKQGYGWAGDVNLRFIFEKLFGVTGDGGYPEHRYKSHDGAIGGCK